MEAVQEQGKECGAWNSSYDKGLYAPFPVNKLNQPSSNEKEKVQVVLVATGSFNPPTNMHLQMFELGRDTLVSHGFHVLGAYMSPVNDAYAKLGLVSAEHRVRMCQLATAESPFIMVDPWEVLQPSYQRTLAVLAHVADALHSLESVNAGTLRVMLLCGADLVESFSIPGVWVPDQVQAICRDYGIVCVSRGGRDFKKIISGFSVLSEHKEKMFIVDGFECDISSTMVRENLSKGISVEHLTPVSVISYVKSNNLYSSNSCQVQLS